MFVICDSGLCEGVLLFLVLVNGVFDISVGLIDRCFGWW